MNNSTPIETMITLKPCNNFIIVAKPTKLKSNAIEPMIINESNTIATVDFADPK
jgi:hypothetical protein